MRRLGAGPTGLVGERFWWTLMLVATLSLVGLPILSGRAVASPRLRVTVKPTVIQPGKRMVASGRVAGTITGSRHALRVRLQERSERRWQVRASARLERGSRFKVSWRVPQAARAHKLRLRLTKGKRVLATSARWMLSVKPPPAGSAGPGGGSAAPGGGSPSPGPGATPCDKTLSPGGNVEAFVNSLIPGQTGCLRGGSYGSTSTSHGLSVSGTSAARVTVTSYPGETATIHGFVEISGAYMTLRRLKIDGSNAVTTTSPCSVPVSQSLVISGSNNIFEYNEYYQSNASSRGNGIGIGWWGTADNTVIRYNKLHDVGSCYNYDHIIYLADGDNVSIHGNWLWGTSHGWGIQLYPGPSNARVFNNVIDGAGSGFVICDEGGGTTHDNRVFHNVIANSTGMVGKQGFQFPGSAIDGCGPSGSGNTFTDNLSFNNPGGIGSVPNVIMSQNTTADPLFVDRASHDYRVAPNSPAASWGLWDGAIP